MLYVQDGIRLGVNGHLGGGNGPSISQEGLTAVTFLRAGGTIVAQFGFSSTFGSIQIGALDTNTFAIIQGDLYIESTTISFVYGASGFAEGRFKIEGNVTWDSGYYQPNVNGAVSGMSDRWLATGTITVSAWTAIDPFIVNAGGAGVIDRWKILEGRKGITTAFGNDAPTSVVGAFSDHWSALRGTDGLVAWWDLHTD